MSSLASRTTALRSGVPATVIPRPRRNSSRPSSRSCRSARKTVFELRHRKPSAPWWLRSVRRRAMGVPTDPRHSRSPLLEKPRKRRCPRSIRSRLSRNVCPTLPGVDGGSRQPTPGESTLAQVSGLSLRRRGRSVARRLGRTRGSREYRPYPGTTSRNLAVSMNCRNCSTLPLRTFQTCTTGRSSFLPVAFPVPV